MSSTRVGLRWGLAALSLFILASVTVVMVLFLQGDCRVQHALSRLRVGMTDSEVQQTLQRITTTARIVNQDGEVQYHFYGVGEFVTVVVQPVGQTKRVIDVKHVPDRDPPGERYRRRLEDRFR